MSQLQAMIARHWSTRVSGPGRRLAHTAADPMGTPVGGKAYRRVGPCLFFVMIWPVPMDEGLALPLVSSPGLETHFVDHQLGLN